VHGFRLGPRQPPGPTKPGPVSCPAATVCHPPVSLNKDYPNCLRTPSPSSAPLLCSPSSGPLADKKTIPRRTERSIMARIMRFISSRIQINCTRRAAGRPAVIAAAVIRGQVKRGREGRARSLAGV